ncbi:polysaccharide biosynthesis/export family protein [Bradyrhizobium sp. GCM10027634]|uniref:polysaccharide biosynthesis/export family protein n=1 Tax=unclassified Bradyrhizobium TaxID=2631580 RepID=UPI00263B491D|nr:polysaccharide biosynthesis/export family protein [Bradyrhizobium sp. WYCCWR 12677]MDN5001383.1 polysaccharide biosynthesis/export family protein [Bradyrhizobium sp. WYCCWR 12677]
MLLLGAVSGVALLGLGTVKNWEAIQAASAGIMQSLSAESGAPQGESVNAAADSTVVLGSSAPLATSIDGNPTLAASTVSEPPKMAEQVETSRASLLVIGDRLKLAFYERVDVEEDKWGRPMSASALRGILQRPELSGEYLVQEDGTISVPLLGLIPVANRSEQQVQEALAERFEQLLGRRGMVSVLSIERSPIYVLGPVKNAGSFKYVSGLTVLHAIALAGGLDRGANEPWQKIEAVREIQKRSGAVDAMLKLLARAAVLKAERDGTATNIPPRLIELVGSTEAANIVNEQSDRRKAVAIARKNREHAIMTALESAKQDVAVYGRTEALDELVKLRQDRVNSMRALVDRNVLSMTVLNQVQSELTDAEQRRKDALNQYGMAKQRLASMEAEAMKVQADVKGELETEIEMVERQIADNERELSISEGVLATLPATRGQFAKEANRMTYEIVRHTANGPVAIASSGTSLLMPGDLVNIVTSESAKAQAAVSAAPMDDRPPAGRAADRSDTTGRAIADKRTGQE